MAPSLCGSLGDKEVNVAHDLFAETNPAYCAYALVGFTRAFATIDSDGPELPVAYLALPVALSADLNDTFMSTNKNTGLLDWLKRSPQIQIGLGERVNASMDIVTEAVRFGCFSRALLMDQAARLKLGQHKIQKRFVKTLSASTAQSLRHAERLGYWFAAVGSTRSVFDLMGLTT
jgi:hypothetical protein